MDATDSTADLGNDTPPPAGGPAPETEVDDTQDTPLTLTAEQVTAAGIGDLKPGDEFSVTIKGTVTDNTDGGLVADIDEIQKAEGTPPAKTPPAPKIGRGMTPSSPEEMGFGASSPNPSNPLGSV